MSGLGRFAGNYPTAARDTHYLAIVESSTKTVITNVSLNLGKMTSTVDLNGYAWAKLAANVSLQEGKTYYIVSSEHSTSSDVVYGSNALVETKPGYIHA